jgi:hypothetical protein
MPPDGFGKPADAESSDLCSMIDDSSAATADDAGADMAAWMQTKEGRQGALVPTIEAVWAVLAVALPVAVTFVQKTQAVDLAYQIRAGESMLTSHSLLDVDTFTYTVRGQPWLNQQWLAQIVLGFLFRGGGWAAISFARGGLLALTVFLLYRSCRAVGARPRTAALLTIAGWFVTIEILPMLRPQQFGFALFALCVWALTTRREHPRRVWLLPLAVIPWANVHGSFPLALVLLGFAYVEDCRDRRAARRVVLAAGACVLASFANPYGVRVWSYVVDLSTHPVVSHRVAEWGPPSIHTPTGLLFFLSLFGVFIFAARRRPVPWLPLILLFVFAALALLAIRGVAWWGLIAPVVVAGVIRDEAKARDPDRSPINLAVISLLIVLVAFSPVVRRGTDPASGAPALLSFAPESLVAAAREAAPQGGNVFVSQLYASWSEFSAQDLAVAVDSRIEIFPESVWQDYFAISNGREGWESLLDRWKVHVLVLNPDQAEGLLQVIGDHSEWKLAASNEMGSVYVRDCPCGLTQQGP